jgi:hypothetical protein
MDLTQKYIGGTRYRVLELEVADNLKILYEVKVLRNLLHK